MLIGMIYDILGVIYGLVLLKEDDGFTKILGVILLVISALGMLAFLAMEISR